MKRPTSTATRSISISISSLTKKHAITIVVVAVLIAAALLNYLLGMKKRRQNDASYYSSSARNVPIAARMDLPPTVGNPTGPNRGPVRPPGPGDFDDPSVY